MGSAEDVEVGAAARSVAEGYLEMIIPAASFSCPHSVIFIPALQHVEPFLCPRSLAGRLIGNWCLLAVHVLVWPESCCSLWRTFSTRAAVITFCCPNWMFV